MSAPIICWLGQKECHERSLAGGKAAPLSRLAATFRVPPGFCLTGAAFDNVVSSGILDAPMHTAVKLPEAMFEELSRAYMTLAERCGTAQLPVAVRSSGLSEDGTSSSFAGQYETFLNIVGIEAVAERVMRCWASALSMRAQKYQTHQGHTDGRLRMAVLIQQFVFADSSAVLFSANPITRNRSELVINASWGLGESIVGGTVTPDTYVLRASDLSIISQQIAEKRYMTVPISEGTREVDVPRFLRIQPVLNDDQVTELGRLGGELEAAMGWPVDVECVYQAGQLYLLQCRPITTLSSLLNP
jgi:phosphoenolpyruvate synthase/pyruvate phosphate dikinase